MIVEPKVREYICTTAHPVGCRESVRRQMEYVKSKGPVKGPEKVLIIGSSTGYGLASRITAAFGCGADTLGIMFERAAAGSRTATAGWYNTKAFEEFARREGHYAKTLNGDAFSRDMKDQAIQTIRDEMGTVDLVIYSLAAPRRTTADGTTYTSSLKTTNSLFTNKSLDLRNNQIVEKSVEPATAQELEGTVKVMGGEDWKDWIHALKDGGVLDENAVTVAYSYIGPELTYPIYYEGTIGEAKKHLHKTAGEINSEVPGVQAYVSVNKALVTQASATIPIVPLYIAVLYKVMKEQGSHEGCIEQISRLFRDKLFVNPVLTDKSGLIRMDDWELEPQIQTKIMELWDRINTENVNELADIQGYWEDFYHMFGFRYENVDYTEDVEV